jgi:hypothetical protein
MQAMPEQCVCRRAAVEQVADQRMTDASHVHTNLMPAPRPDLHTQKRRLFVGKKHREAGLSTLRLAAMVHRR